MDLYLREKVKEYEEYIARKGVDNQLLEAYTIASKHAYTEDKLDYAKKVSARAKELINGEILKQTNGGNFFALDTYANANGTGFDILDNYYAVLKAESPYLFDSYMLYLEKDRLDKDKFYKPRRKCFQRIGVINALQSIEDDELDLLSLSFPPSTGKAQPLYSKVLTPNGFVNMGDIKVGDEVISGTGNVCKVLGVYPQGIKPIYEITLRDGMKCRCSNEHLWTCWQDMIGKRTVSLEHIMNNGWRTFLIPIYGYELDKNPIKSIEYIGEEECQCIYIDDPSHLYITDDYIITHNTTLEKFFTSWVIGKDIDGYSLFFSHSGDITRMYYDGVLDITTNEQEYKWREIFPEAVLQGTNAKAEHINFGKYKPFSSIQCTSVGSKNAGKVRCSKYLLCDDMIGGIEEALNKNILDKLWSIYSVDARQRKTDGCKEIHIATRWSVHDIIGRLQNTFADDPRAKFIAYPDIDPVTGESNFNYDINGFSVDFYNSQALLMDDISYRCLYKNEPIEREGLLYHDDDLRRYMTLPLEEPDAIIGVCDTKTTGSDFMVLPVFYQYGEDYYMVDCICDSSSDFGVQENRLANIIVDHNMQQCEFESNAGGSRLAKEVADLVNSMGGRCNITTKPTETNKETRIIVNSDWIKKHCLFKDKELYTRKSDYGEFMYWLLGYSVTGKNIHDDVPDCLSNFALYCTKDSRVARVEAVRNPFRGFW